MVFGFLKKNAPSVSSRWMRRFSNDGVLLRSEGETDLLQSELVEAFLAQLLDDGFAVQGADAEVRIPWAGLYGALRSPGYADLHGVLELPDFCSYQIGLQSKGSLTDADFSISIAGWRSAEGRIEHPVHKGALLSRDSHVEIMSAAQWDLFQEVLGFARRSDEERNELFHRQAWGRIRLLALAAQARLDDFLHRSVVVTPERLDIGLRKSGPIAGDNVIEILPGFSGAPEDWLERFDSAKSVLDRYDIPTESGIVQVLITPSVRTVLEEIKRLPLRRVAGSRAQAFTLNPFSALGPDAKDVIDEGKFESARERAGLQYERFSPLIERDQDAYPVKVGLLIETATSQGISGGETVWLSDPELLKFIEKLEHALARGFQLLGWTGYDLELQGDSTNHLAELRTALTHRANSKPVISYAQVHDLSAYSSRVEGIGDEKPYYSPYIAKVKEDLGWFPENVLPLISYTPEGEIEPVVVPATDDALNGLREAVTKAEWTSPAFVDIFQLPVRSCSNTSGLSWSR